MKVRLLGMPQLRYLSIPRDACRGFSSRFKGVKTYHWGKLDGDFSDRELLVIKRGADLFLMKVAGRRLDSDSVRGSNGWRYPWRHQVGISWIPTLFAVKGANAYSRRMSPVVGRSWILFGVKRRECLSPRNNMALVGIAGYAFHRILRMVGIGEIGYGSQFRWVLEFSYRGRRIRNIQSSVDPPRRAPNPLGHPITG